MSRNWFMPTALAVALSCALPAHADDWRSKSTAHVAAAVDRGETLDVLIKMRGDAALRLVDQRLPFTDKTTAVAVNLMALAQETQAPLLSTLRAQGVSAKSLWIANAVAARLTPAQIAEIAARDDVAVIESDRAFKVPLDVQEPLAPNPDAPGAVSAIEWNVAKVRAPDAWALGFRGQGVVVGGQDTGYNWTHPAIVNKYRGQGTPADHNYNWHDAINADIDGSSNPCGISAVAPCDDNSHGTHTIGTVLGDDGGANQIGVAPDAKWIGCRNMDAGTGRPSTYIECMQWFLAPTNLAGTAPDPTKAPHITTNSWGCPIGPPPSGEDCAVNSFDAMMTAMRTAGILTVVSAGNSGSSCATVLAPPSFMAAAFTIGSTTNTSNNAISSFSSRGPATADGSNRLKPDVVGPGSSVRSAVLGTAYQLKSGTSMSAPAVAGVAALAMSADPGLIGHPDVVEDLLKSTAVPLTSTQDCGGFLGANVPNAVFGHGLVNALAAVQAVGTPPPDDMFAHGFED